MYDVTGIGEILIDFIQTQYEFAWKKVKNLTKVCDCAPANIATIVTKLQDNVHFPKQVKKHVVLYTIFLEWMQEKRESVY